MSTPIHPGVFFKHTYMLPLKVSVLSAGELLGLPRKVLNAFIDGKMDCTVSMIRRLAKHTNTTPESWFQMQVAYSEWKEKQE